MRVEGTIHTIWNNRTTHHTFIPYKGHDVYNANKGTTGTIKGTIRERKVGTIRERKIGTIRERKLGTIGTIFGDCTNRHDSARYSLFVTPEVRFFDWFSKFFPFLLRARRLSVHLPRNMVIFSLLSTHL